MNEYTFNPEHGEIFIHEDLIPKHWEIRLNQRGVAFLIQSLQDPDDIISIKGEIEGEAWLSFNTLIGSGAPTKMPAVK